MQEECKGVAEEDKMRYQGEVQAWARAHPDLAQGLHKHKLPTKRGMNGYVLFMKDFQCGPSPLCSYLVFIPRSTEKVVQGANPQEDNQLLRLLLCYS